MSNISTIGAGIAFCALAAANVVVMLEASQPSQWHDEDPIDRCPAGWWVLVRDPVLHHGLQHESETCWFGGDLPSAYIPGLAYRACARSRAFASAENIDRVPL
jgi:hypothetical protein